MNSHRHFKRLLKVTVVISLSFFVVLILVFHGYLNGEQVYPASIAKEPDKYASAVKTMKVENEEMERDETDVLLPQLNRANINAKIEEKANELQEQKASEREMEGKQEETETDIPLRLDDWTQNERNARKNWSKKKDILIPHREKTTEDPFQNLLKNYLPLEKLDYPDMGDFPCSASLAVDSCLVHRKNVRDFQILCNRMGSYCKGFVVTRGRIGEIISYFKNEIRHLRPNNRTITFVKRDFLDKVKLPDLGDKKSKESL